MPHYIVQIHGAPGRIRTCGLRIRSPTLYPAELRAHNKSICNGVSEGARTLDIQDHNLALCQLSYTHHKQTPDLYQLPKQIATFFLKSPMKNIAKPGKKNHNCSMTFKGFLFIIPSALLHVLWNSMLKKSHDKPSAVLLMMVKTVSGLAIGYFVFRETLPPARAISAGPIVAGAVLIKIS